MTLVMNAVYEDCDGVVYDDDQSQLSKGEAIDLCMENWGYYGGCFFGCLNGTYDCGVFGNCLNECFGVGNDHGTECTETMNSFYDGCGFSFIDGNGNLVTKSDAIDECIDEWEYIGGCFYGCFESAQTCDDFPLCQ